MINENLRKYIVTKRISMRQISRETGIKEHRLYSVFRENSRKLRVEEFLKICRFLKVNPFDFLDDEE